MGVSRLRGGVAEAPPRNSRNHSNSEWVCELFYIKTLTIWVGESTNSGPMCTHGNVP